MVTVAATVARIREDRARIEAVLADHASRAGGVSWFDPSFQSVILHRWSHFFFCRGNRLLARFLWHLNLTLTGADISPISDIAGGLTIVEPLACVLIGKAGRNLTIRGHSSFGGGMSREDIGAGPGLPVLGNDVVLDFGAVVLGPVFIGDGTYIGPRCVVRTSVPERSSVMPLEPKVRRLPVSDEVADVAEAEPRQPSAGFVASLRRDLAADIKVHVDRSTDFSRKKLGLLRSISVLATPALLCVLLYRVSHALWVREWRTAARFIGRLNYLVHKAWITPESSIGPGLYLPHTAGVIFEGSAGRELTLFANAIVGETYGTHSGVRQGRPTLGNDVVIAAFVVVVGALSIQERARVGPASVITCDVAADCMTIPAARLKILPAQSVNATPQVGLTVATP